MAGIWEINAIMIRLEKVICKSKISKIINEGTRQLGLVFKTNVFGKAFAAARLLHSGKHSKIILKVHIY